MKRVEINQHETYYEVLYWVAHAPLGIETRYYPLAAAGEMYAAIQRYFA